MAEPLFTNCKVEFVPVVDFKFVDVCQIPDLPPPIFDCASPMCPQFEPPPPCPTIDGGPVTVNVLASSPDCPNPTPPGGTFTVTSNEQCEFNLSLALDIPVPIPPCPDFSAGKTTVTANYGSCEPSTGEITVTPQENVDPCDNSGACKFDLGLDLSLSIPPPPCPTITVVGTADSKADKLTGTGSNTPGTCGTPECNIEIKITHPPIPTPPEIQTTINTFFTTNVGPIENYLTTNIEELVTNIIGPTINTYINTGGGGTNKTCIPKYTGGKINVTKGATPGGQLTVADENQQKHCEYQTAPANVSCPRCYFTGPAGVERCVAWPSTAQDCLEAGGQPYTIGPVGLVGDPDADAGCGSPLVYPTICENVDGQDNPEGYCANKGGTIHVGPCGSQKKCPDLKITADLTVPDTCVTTYYGGDIAVSFDENATAASGEITIDEASGCRSCYYPENSVGAILAAGGQVGVSTAPAVCVPGDSGGSGDNSTLCADRGGTCYPSAGCSESCDDKEITATLTLPKSLCDIKFKASEEVALTKSDCGSDDPFVKIKVEIEKSGTDGEYEITVSGSFCSCCGGTKTEPEAPADE